MPKTLSRQDLWRQQARAKDPDYDKRRRLAEHERRDKRKQARLEAGAASENGATAAATPAPAPTAAAAAAPSAATRSSAAAPSTANAAADAADDEEEPDEDAAAAAEADEDDEAWKERRNFSYNFLKESEAESYQLGRAQAAIGHKFEDDALIEMMQSQLQKASYTIDYLAESLDFSERRNYCNTCHVTLRPAENPHLSYLADRADEIELLKLMSKESIEELRLRHHASGARHGV